MKRHGLLGAPVLGATLVLGLLGGVATAADAPAPKATRLLIYHAWDSPSELAALKALLDRFQATHPDVSISTPGVHRDPRNLFPILRKLAAGDVAPESFHAHPGYGAQPFIEGGLLSPIDDVWASEQLATVVPSVIRNLSQADGHYYAVPVGTHRVNLVWYNKAVLDRHGIDASTLGTWDRFFKAADLLRTKGMAAPIVLAEGWTGSVVFQAIVAGLGMDVYEQWVNGKLTQPGDPALMEALKIFGRYLTYVNPDHADLTWDKALQRVVSGEAAFCVMGDWANGEFRVAGKKHGKDYGAMLVPGTKGMYGVAIDAFLQPRGVVSPANASAWLKLVASRDGQDAFNVLKGSIPPRTDPDVARYDVYQKTAIADLKNARFIYPAADEAVPDAYRAALVDILSGFAIDRDATRAAKLLAQTASRVSAKYTRRWSLK